MLFSTPTFLYLFLPAVLALHLVLPRRFRNAGLLLASLVFYAWGEREIVAVMLLSIGANYGFGRRIEALLGGCGDAVGARRVVGYAVAFNLGLLVLFKYTSWLLGVAANAVVALGADPAWSARVPVIHLPIGISFFTFQALSYIIDLFRGQEQVQRRPVDVALYISLFPQLIAGPIVRYHDVAGQIVRRTVDRAGFAEGVRRFVIGLGKKMLIANTVALPADQIFAIPAADLTPAVAWLGIACYTIQIYFDFSGYSDMAIGLGRMLGFRFLENFQFPYVSRSVTEFWRRWHISLSTWFRDYLYVPLGGNRHGPLRTYRNLLVVFLLCGLWHGAAWNFVAWGLFHGAFLIVERVGVGRVLERTPGALRHAYLLLIVAMGWVLFRAPDLSSALGYAATLFGAGAGSGRVHHVGLYVDTTVWLALGAGVVGSTPWRPALERWRRDFEARARSALARKGFDLAESAVLFAVFALSAMMLSADTYNPFIYFRF